MNPLIGEPGRGEDRAQRDEPPRTHSRLLLELAAGAGLGVLPGVELSGRNLVNRSTGRVAVLANQQHPVVVQEGDDRRGAGMADHVELDSPAVRQLDLFGNHFEELAALTPPFCHFPPPSQADSGK